MTIWRCKMCGRVSNQDAPEGWEIGYDYNFYGGIANIRITCDRCLNGYPGELTPVGESETRVML